MPSKIYTIWLNETAYLVVDVQAHGGTMIDFVVRLVHVRDSIDVDVARYDTAHGLPHRDLVSPDGRLRQKDWLEGLCSNDALTFAIDDFKENYEEYIHNQT